jgi:hypothetical protein
MQKYPVISKNETMKLLESEPFAWFGTKTDHTWAKGEIVQKWDLVNEKKELNGVDSADELLIDRDLVFNLKEKFEKDRERVGLSLEGINSIESMFSSYFYEFMTELKISPDALCDPGFWRYLSMGPFWWFVTWRQKKAFGHISPSGSNRNKHILIRCYARGRICAEGNQKAPYELSMLEKQGDDLWQSHIIGVTTNYSLPLSRAILRKQNNLYLKTDALREVVKRRINRANVNSCMEVIDDIFAARIVNMHWPKSEEEAAELQEKCNAENKARRTAKRQAQRN